MSKMRIAAAADKADEARARLMDTIEQLADLLEPNKIARDLWESAKVKGADMAEDAVDAVKRRPVATGGIIAAVAMFLAREPIKDGVSKFYDAMTSNKDEAEPPPARPKPPARKPAARRKRTASRTTRKTEITS